MRITRRRFLKGAALASLGPALAAGIGQSGPLVLTPRRTRLQTEAGRLLFAPRYVQSGRGPHLLEWAYATDPEWDAFHSNITATVKEGVSISDAEGRERFGINVRWNVEGFGYIFITADNAGEFYTLPPAGQTRTLNLNYELAASRVARNRKRLALHARDGWVPSVEVACLVSASEEYLSDARKLQGKDDERSGACAQDALRLAMWASEMLELEKARAVIRAGGYRPEFYLGCDARGIYEMHENLFMERFTELFNFATITYFWGKSGVIEEFEPDEGKTQYDMRDLAFKKLRDRGLAVEGRAITWFHKWVTPSWLKTKSFDQLKSYVERHTREMVGHYADGMYAWEIVNELHDWANEVQLTPEQTVELTALACDVAKATAPRVQRVVNNCCPYAEYVQLGEWSGQKAKYRQRTPWQFMKDLADAGVDYTMIGQQMYFPYRDLQDIVLYLERFAEFKKPLHLSEVGASAGPTEELLKTGKVKLPTEPYVWHRPWDEELQADWMEGVYTLAYSKRFIEGAHWFDFVDPFYYIETGGILRSPRGEKKAAFDRLLDLERAWKGLPRNARPKAKRSSMSKVNSTESATSTASGGIGSLVVNDSTIAAPEVLTQPRTTSSSAGGTLVFRPDIVQSGRGPHLLEWAYATDPEWDAFHSNITATVKEGVSISDAEGRERFGINVRWNVEGFGYIFITADNAGEFYTLPPAGQTRTLNLNYELAASRVARNRKRLALHARDGWTPSHELRAALDISAQYLEDARRALQKGAPAGMAAQTALLHAMRASEMIELEKARAVIDRRKPREGFFIGCDARGYFQMDVELFLSLFPQLFNYATITHYLVSGVFEDFEPEEGMLQYDLRDALLRQLRRRGITVEGRPLWWSYRTTTPDWLRAKTYDQVRRYVEKHVREVVRHYGDGMYAWEVVNEFHDWANECRLKPDEIIEVTRLACDVCRDTRPGVKRLINNCAPFAEYVQLRKMTELDAFYPQRTPFQFVRQLAEAGVDFDISGIQMYFPYRDLADTILLVEKFERIGKTIQLTEVGASAGPSLESVQSGKLTISNEPYVWHRPWDEELQADWMEGLYTLAYARPSIEAVNWYDFVDPFSWIPNGGFLRTPKGEKRAVYDRLLTLRQRWHLPVKASS